MAARSLAQAPAPLERQAHQLCGEGVIARRVGTVPGSVKGRLAAWRCRRVLRSLLDRPGRPGYEEPPTAVWREAASAFAEVTGDSLGSSIARVPGTGKGPLLAIVGHIDEIGLDRHAHRRHGYVFFRPLGGVERRGAPSAQRVDRAGDATESVPGVVERAKQKVRKGADAAADELDDLHIDIGAKDGDEARKLVRPGDAVVIARRAGRAAERPRRLALARQPARRVTSRSRRRGASPRPAARRARSPRSRRCRRRSATSAARAPRRSRSSPAIAIAVDVTHATDVPGGDPKVEGEHRPRQRPGDLPRPDDQPEASSTCSRRPPRPRGSRTRSRSPRGRRTRTWTRCTSVARGRRDGARLDPAPLHAHADRDRRPRGRRAVRPAARRLRPRLEPGRQLHPLTLG